MAYITEATCLVMYDSNLKSKRLAKKFLFMVPLKRLDCGIFHSPNLIERDAKTSRGEPLGFRQG
jgi:hypothetical protein